MSYIISIVESVLILGTLLTSLNYKEDEYIYGKYELIDKGKIKFPLWIYVLSGVLSVIYIVNYVVAFSCLVTALVYNPLIAETCKGERTRIYLNIRIPFIKKFIELLNKKI